ncbi:MAG: HDIG domain-containing protein [Treponema sp.]|jgi:putative nucleotidyltransferase with HDIG domain|nr:HDIG domain-containing protein [Treponema sp.]
MMMKKNNDPFSIDVFHVFLKSLGLPKLRLGPSLAAGLSFLVSTLALIGGMAGTGSAGNVEEFEAGRVAERDVIAEQPVSYIDEEATRLRTIAQERLVPAVFSYSLDAGEAILGSYNRFAALSGDLFDKGASEEAYKLAIQAEFPGKLSPDTLEALFKDPQREQFLKDTAALLEELLETGIFALPEAGLEQYNPDMVELLHNYGSRTERERVPYDRIITMGRIRDAAASALSGSSFPPSFEAIAPALIQPFLAENVFFSPKDTAQRLSETRAQVEPVVKSIEEGKRVIRKGFIISDEDMARLRALNVSASHKDPRLIIGRVLMLFLVFGLLVFMGGVRTVRRILSPAEVYLLSALSAVYFIGAVFLQNLSLGEYLPSAIVVPTALVIMLPSILISPQLAAVMAMVLPLGAFLSGPFDLSSYVFALTSGIVAAYAIQRAEKRMDLVKAGFIIAAANAVVSVGILLIQRFPPAAYPPFLFWAAFNGVASGMLVLGFLPLMEHALNAATVFRLIELSDLNSPILKRLFIAAPGTYSHSMMVANLAEAACQEIGANSLLARVGAYYHDIGKIEQPDYFVENQTAYNKHEDIAPRLSATVIRSHVKLGIEKARNLRLPQEVTDIIAEHHGNSVISWFYNEALKRESQVDMEDFTYPGNPPRSRESAVVMLADVTEAASRTLKKPSAARLEKFIQVLIMSKFEHGQLAESELTFRDLETIKRSFVRVLAGHYHSRIEYPKLPKEGSPSNGGHE